MTCIAGIEEDGVVYIGADSAGVAGHLVTARADSKLFRSGGLIGGFASSFRMGQVLRGNLGGRIDGQANFDPELHLGDILRSLFRDKGCLTIENNVESCGTFLFGWNGTLHVVYSDFQIARPIDKFASVGCGEELALGHLEATNEYDIDPTTRIRSALQCAAKFSGGVRGPFSVEKAGAE